MSKRSLLRLASRLPPPSRTPLRNLTTTTRRSNDPPSSSSSSYTYQPPKSSYTPPNPTPSPPTADPSTRNSSGYSQAYKDGIVDDHPMPDNMPREDYSSPTLYSLELITRVLKYLIYGTLGLGFSSLLAVEAAHQYVENVSLNYPSHIPDPGNASSESDDGFYAWAEENDSWTGGSKGGTSPSLGFYARHALRSAWIAQELGAGSNLGSSISQGQGDGGVEGGLHGGVGGGALKGMISRNKGKERDGAGVNNVDAGYLMAEGYLTRTIEEAQKRGILFPPELPGIRPTPTVISTESTDLLAEPSTLPQPDRVAIDLLLRHADVLERIATPSALSRASKTYERLLRSYLSDPGASRSSSSSSSPLSSAPATTTSAPNSRGLDLHKSIRTAEILTLSRKLGELNWRLGEEEAATGWWRWGLSYAGVASPSSGGKMANEALQAAAATGASPVKRGWFDGWFGVKAGAVATPTEGMEHTLAQNTVVPITTIDYIPPSPSTPLVQRALVSLIASYATNLALTNDLPSAAAYQQLGLSVATTTSLKGKSATEPAAMHDLWLAQRAALLSLNSVEVGHALGSDVTDSLKRLGETTKKIEDVIRNLGSPYYIESKPVPSSSSSSSTSPLTSYNPAKAIPLKPTTLATRFTSSSASSAALKRPAQQLLRDSQRTAAEAWSLSGLLYERLSRSNNNSNNPSQVHELRELALDCHERSLGFLKIARGGSAHDMSDLMGDEDALGVGMAGMRGRGDGKGMEYWRNYMRVRGKIEGELSKTREEGQAR